MAITRTRTIRKNGVTLKIKTTTPSKYELQRDLERAIKSAIKK